MGYTIKEEIESFKLSYYGVDRWKKWRSSGKKGAVFDSNLKKWRYTVFGMLILKRGEKG